MAVYKVNLTDHAESDLREIARYISSQLNAPTTALNMVRTVKTSIAKLRTSPFAHPLVKDERLASIGYRALFIKNYYAFYIVNKKEKAVTVDRILYGRRDWQSLL